MNKKPGRLLLAALVAVAAFGASANAAEQCRGPGGQFIKCPVMTPMHCRDKTTKKFAKCEAPNTERIPTAATPSPAPSPAPAAQPAK